MNPIEAHYAQPGLLGRVREVLRAGGMDPDRLVQAELEKLDQFHAGGLNATDSLARLAAIRETDRVLDLGSGIGGPSRHLASSVGCHVVGVDLTAEYCQVATMLAASTGWSHLVSYQQGDALHTPFADHSFHVVWTQHASMNIEDKRGLYREIFRLLEPGGRLALHDVVAGAGEVRYPVPWASRGELSFLISAPDLESDLTAQGFRKLAWHDSTKQGLEALQAMRNATPSPGFGVATLLGRDFPVMISNLIANLQSGACAIVQAVFVK